MLRLTGILTGSALAIAALFVVIGVPQFTSPPQPDFAVADTSPAKLDIEEPEPIPEPEALPQPEADTAPVPEEVNDTPTTLEPVPEAPEAIAVESRWFSFWSPFRSQIAADGFVSELQRTTGLDYRVVKLKPGVYEVAFEYSDDLDRDNKLSRIADATGLDLSDG